jgi:hypothetical protein
LAALDDILLAFLFPPLDRLRWSSAKGICMKLKDQTKDMVTSHHTLDTVIEALKAALLAR